MDWNTLYKQWLAEEDCAHIHGWDFSHIHGRYEEEHDLPWDYGEAVRDYLRPEHRLLDLDTGGGEFLLSLEHPHRRTAATEYYPPNAALCRETLCPLGIDFRQADASGPLPFPDGSFDIIINRHGNYCTAELARLLRPGGVFVTEQVGEQNDRELVELLLPGTPLPFPGHNLARRAAELEEAGFTLLRQEEAFRPILFYDVGALVWFARIIQWEFPGFSVERCLDRLRAAQEILERDGRLTGSIHRFLLSAKNGDKGGTTHAQ